MQTPDRPPDQVRFLGPDETGDTHKVIERWNLTDEEKAARKVQAHLFPIYQTEDPTP